MSDRRGEGRVTQPRPGKLQHVKDIVIATLIVLASTAFVLAGLCLSVMMFRDTRQTLRLWHAGKVAKGRRTCVWTETMPGVQGTTIETPFHTVEFTAEGRTVQLKEGCGRFDLKEGEAVTVYYAPGQPEKATARPPSRVRACARCALYSVMPLVLIVLGIEISYFYWV
ncbi:hypothetical protein ACFZA9_34075 [Streptomyces olivaceus]|uniref:DUF3592 domain-containing protein n=1 Tax=Streptomyces olivaceus TaxID=47716 RepID=UPI0036E3E40A